MVSEDWSFCPSCKFPALYSSLLTYLSSDTGAWLRDERHSMLLSACRVAVLAPRFAYSRLCRWCRGAASLSPRCGGVPAQRAPCARRRLSRRRSRRCATLLCGSAAATRPRRRRWTATSRLLETHSTLPMHFHTITLLPTRGVTATAASCCADTHARQCESRPLATLSAAGPPHSCFTMVSANGIVVPGPRLVMTLWVTTTSSSSFSEFGMRSAKDG
jgi:hypothetical protein